MQSNAVPDVSAALELRLFGCWDLRSPSGTVSLGGREQRLVALLALRGRRPRVQVAGTLWPDTREERALTSLRSAVMRVRRSAGGLLEIGHSTLALAADVRVDVQQLTRWAAEPRIHGTGRARWWVGVLRDAELLPGWYDDWVLFERERLQHLRLAALESEGLRSLDRGDYDTALMAALEATTIEPLRETAHSILIRAHLLAHNPSAAVEAYRAYRHQLRASMGISPSREMDDLVRPFIVPADRSRPARARH
jgi:DNA-binding SARP family transcriptional activator